MSFALRQADAQSDLATALPAEPLTPPRAALRPIQAAVSTEFSFGASDYDRVRRLIYEHAGIALSDSKQAMVYSRLSRLLRDTGHSNFNDYLRWLESAGNKSNDRWQSFVNALTTNLTAFFREEHHFHELQSELAQRGGKPLRIWCNAASTGEEPYSIAMTVHEALGAAAPVSLLATDIDTNVLAAAQRGVYSIGARGLSPERMRQHFLKGKGDNSALMRIKPELARGIEFRAHNLIHAQWSLGEPFDIVFCRNVMIYFDSPTQHAVLERMHKVMKPGGLLYVGHSESFNDAKHLFRLRGKTIYERV
jgi:chemotaxis protein methyltransferase CheR